MAKKPDEPLTPEVIPPPGNGAADRNRAYRIAKAIKEGASVPPEDLAWYTEYAKAKETRATAKSRKVTFSSEEQESTTTGELAAALAAPQLAREEGRRIDSLIREATNATSAMGKVAQNAFELMLKFATAVLDRNGKLETANIGMLDTFRKSHIEMTHAHAALVQQQAEHDAEATVREAEDAAAANEESGGMVEGIVAQFMPVVMQEIARRAAAAKTTEGK